jgi:GNAT superfamily N-acetyltransferase
METIIRHANETDAAVLAALRWEFRAEDGELPKVPYGEFVDAYTEFFCEGLRQQRRAHFLAEVGGEIVGHVVVQRVPMVPRPKKVHDEWGYVTDNYTKPAFRNKGIGTALLREAIAWSRQQDLELLIVWPSEEAVRHYARAGFVADNDIMELSLRDY